LSLGLAEKGGERLKDLSWANMEGEKGDRSISFWMTGGETEDRATMDKGGTADRRRLMTGKNGPPNDIN